MSARSKRLTFATLGLLLTLLTAQPLWAWCAMAHQRVNAAAVERVCDDALREFYRLQLAAIIAHAEDPDNWRETGLRDLGEPHEHYINLDLLSSAPFTDVPTNYERAVAKYGQSRLEQAGTLPWAIQRHFKELTQSFRDKDWKAVVRRSAWLGHYVADATNPLHVTKNYKGQDTGNVILPERGPNHSVHQRFEWAMVERYPDRVLKLTSPCASKSLPDVSVASWELVRSSWPGVQTVIRADLAAARQDPSFSDTYYDLMLRDTADLARERLDHAADVLASMWLTAWENAGKPDLPHVTVLAEPRTLPPQYLGPVFVLLALCTVTLWMILRQKRAR